MQSVIFLHAHAVGLVFKRGRTVTLTPPKMPPIRDINLVPGGNENMFPAFNVAHETTI